MKVIVTKDIEIRGRDEKPRINVSLSLKASDEPQSLPTWAARQAIRRDAAEEIKKSAKAVKGE